MQNEDDLRGLAKVMDFMRAISILFVVINIYWFCYQSFREWGINSKHSINSPFHSKNVILLL